jgi:hypothetical protein
MRALAIGVRTDPNKGPMFHVERSRGLAKLTKDDRWRGV